MTFGNFRLDVERGCLLADGVEIPLRPKTFALLSYLLGNPGRLVSKDELIRAVWRGGVVTDDVLVQSVGELRRALGKEGAAFIRTVPRRGYRFEAAVAAPAPGPSSLADPPARRGDADVIPDAVASPPVQRPRWPLYAAALVLLAAVSSVVAWKHPAQLEGRDLAIAVLPFTAASDTPEQQQLADDLTRDVITGLSRFSRTVMTWRDVQPYRGDAADSRKVATELDVQYQVEGAVRQAAGRVIVNVQLVNSRGKLLRPFEFSEPPAGELVLREKLARQIAAALNLHLSQSELRLAAAKSPDGLTAADLVQRARLGMRTGSQTEDSGVPIADVRNLLKEATELDPSYAPARSMLAETYLMTVLSGTEHPEHYLNRAREEAEHAAKLDDQDIRARVVLGHVYLFQARYEEARRVIDRVLDINPYDSDGLAARGHILVYLGETDAAIEALEKARNTPSRYDGLGGWDNYALSLAYYLKGRYEDAIKISGAPDPDHLPDRPSAGFDLDSVWAPAALLAASHAQLNHAEHARKYANFARRAPDFASRIPAYAGKLRKQEDQDHLRAGLIKARLLLPSQAPHGP